jgi:hypothetical protein
MDNAQQIYNAPPYAITKLPISLTPIRNIATSMYFAAYQQQPLAGYLTRFAPATITYM